MTKIPRIIHYCWFGNNPKNKLAKKCISSWKKYCKDYEIIEWNETNFDISSAPAYVREAYENKKWAFVTDYVRLKVIYAMGGIYLDTDVELIKPIDDFLEYPAFFGFQNGKEVATGLGFGAEKHSKIVADLMKDYEGISFIQEDGTMDMTPCPKRNLHVFLDRGLLQDDSRQILSDGTLVFETEVLSPIDCETLLYRVTDNTRSIHWYAASWVRTDKLHVRIMKRIFGQRIYYYYLEFRIRIYNKKNSK